MRNFHRRSLFGLTLLLALGANAEPPAFQADPAASRLYDFATRDAQFRALVALPEVDVQYGKFGRLRELKGATGIFVLSALKLKRGDSADVLFQKAKPMLMASAGESLVVRTTAKLATRVGILYDTTQVIDGIPVIDAGVTFEVDPNGQIIFISSLFVPKGTASTKPKISLQQARQKLQEYLAGLADSGSVTLGEGGSLAFWTNAGTLERPKLVWNIEASYARFGEPKGAQYAVDAETGKVLSSHSGAFALNRTVYTNNYIEATVTPPPQGCCGRRVIQTHRMDPHTTSISTCFTRLMPGRATTLMLTALSGWSPISELTMLRRAYSARTRSPISSSVTYAHRMMTPLHMNTGIRSTSCPPPSSHRRIAAVGTSSTGATSSLLICRPS